MKFYKGVLATGGIFNSVMGLFFINGTLLGLFLDFALKAEQFLFARNVSLNYPQDPVHRLLIQGFGAAALILGATLFYAAGNPAKYRAFILIDAVGRLLYGSLMISTVLNYDLPRVILVFGIVELAFGISYMVGANRST